MPCLPAGPWSPGLPSEKQVRVSLEASARRHAEDEHSNCKGVGVGGERENRKPTQQKASRESTCKTERAERVQYARVAPQGKRKRAGWRLRIPFLPGAPGSPSIPGGP